MHSNLSSRLAKPDGLPEAFFLSSHFKYAGLTLSTISANSCTERPVSFWKHFGCFAIDGYDNDIV